MEIDYICEECLGCGLWKENETDKVIFCPKCKSNKLIKKYSFGVSEKKNTLTLRETTYKILPKIKFKRKHEKKILLEKNELANYKIKVPFELKKVKRSKSWLGNGLQSDDIHCYSEWEEEVRIYDKDKLSEFIIECFLEHGIDFKGDTNQILNK